MRENMVWTWAPLRKCDNNKLEVRKTNDNMVGIIQKDVSDGRLIEDPGSN